MFHLSLKIGRKKRRIEIAADAEKRILSEGLEVGYFEIRGMCGKRREEDEGQKKKEQGQHRRPCRGTSHVRKTAVR